MLDNIYASISEAVVNYHYLKACPPEFELPTKILFCIFNKGPSP